MSKEFKILLALFLLAFFLRTFKLSTFPFGFHADEVRVGWNALSILKTGADDKGNRFALYYNTFGDYRPAGIFYLTIPSIALFGRSEFAVRFPSALLGALTIFPLYFFVTEMKNRKNLALSIQHLALTASLLLAISPWHVSISRATSEVAISLFFALFGLLFFVKAINQKNKRLFLFSFLALGISYFFYHSIRVLAPIFVGVLSVYFWQNISKSQLTRIVLVTAVGLVTLTITLVSDKEARGRFSQVSIFSDLDVKYELSRMPFEEGPNKVFIARFFHNKPSVYIRRFINEYTKYFSSEFFLNGNIPKPTRYQTVGTGLLTYIEFALLLAGLMAIAQKRQNPIPLFLLLVAPIPAALTTEDSPNLHRAFYMVPFLTIIESYGFSYLANMKNRLFMLRTTNYMLLTLLLLNFVFFLHMYYIHNKVHLPLYRNVGAKELAIYLNEVQDSYDKIILTNIPDDPYPWIAFFTGRDAKIFNKDAVQREKGTWTSENFVFTGLRCPSRDAFEKPDVKRLMVVDAEGCATESNLKNRTDVTLIKRITRPDESEVYNIWSRIE